MAGMLEYKCPCCDGAIQFDSTTQKMKCPYCDTEFEVDALKGYDEDLKDQKPSEMNWATPGGSWAEGETAGLHTYVCKSCGGEIVGDDTMAASACPFCGNPIVLTGQFAGDLSLIHILTEKIKTTGNTNGIAFTKALQTRDFEGLAFVNLVDFDMLYGHRRDVAGYAAAATEFDRFLADFLPGMREGDLLMITADHGCDPSYTKTTDHTREYVPYLVCGKGVKAGMDLGTKLCFGTIAQTICEYLEVDASTLDGKSVWQEIRA